jgi:hypothetical protein
MSESEIERELTEAQADVIRVREASSRRRRAVMAALAADPPWTKYKIAAVLGVGGPTVDAIVKAAQREAGTAG